MKRIIVIVGVLFLGSIFFYMVFLSRPSVPSVTQFTTKNVPMKVIGWIPNWDQDAAVQSYMQHVAAFNYVSVFWYRIDAKGQLTTYQATQEDPALISFVHSHHEKIFALVANLPDYNEQKDWDPQRVQQVIATESARQKHIADLLHLVMTKNFDGLDIDYEALLASQKDNFSIFIQELSQALHEKNKLLGVAVYPPSANVAQEDYGVNAQDLPLLAQSADQLYVMTYLQHTLSSLPGPTGGTSWITDSMQYAIHTLRIPTEKVFMGIGLMGVAWRQNQDGSYVGDRDDIPFSEILSLTQNRNIQVLWDSTSESPFLRFSDENGTHVVWFENAQSVSQKIRLATQLHIGGIAFWRLGNEDPAIWQQNIK